MKRVTGRFRPARCSALLAIVALISGPDASENRVEISRLELLQMHVNSSLEGPEASCSFLCTPIIPPVLGASRTSEFVPAESLTPLRPGACCAHTETPT